jgi:RNA polymerase sigma factor (TIGR02999 family)
MLACEDWNRRRYISAAPGNTIAGPRCDVERHADRRSALDGHHLQKRRVAAMIERPDPDETSHLVESLYEELRAIARRLLRAERDAHTLETSALVHEAFLRLATQQAAQWQGRSHFLGAAATTMRRVLVDYARSRNASKRDGGVRTTLVSAVAIGPRRDDALDIAVLDDVLGRLALIDPRQAQVVELRVFGGFGVEEVAEIIGISPRTVKRDWRFAKAWLTCQLTPAA